MIDANQFDAAAARSARWAISLLKKDGFEGAPNAILGLYKAPMGLLATGHARHAVRAMNVAERHFYRDGDFHARTDDPTPPAGRSYRNAWLAWGAHELGAYHLSCPAFDRLERSLHPESGGAPDNDEVAPAGRRYPAGGTAMVANALLAGGRLDSSVRAGRFLQRLYEEQVDSASHILLARASDGTPIDPDKLGITAGRESLVFDLSKPGQICWIFGLSIRVFARLHRATGETSWLDTAERVRGWLERAHESLYANVTNGKVAWGAAEMYGVTHRREWLALVERIGQWVLDQQGQDGVWVRRPQFATAAQQPVAVSLDTSIERMFYMIDIPRALGLARDF